jgi:hypothetical protein
MDVEDYVRFCDSCQRKKEDREFEENLRTAYKLVAKANKPSHQRNKELHDRKAKARSFEVNDLLYLYTPVTRPGLSRKFRKAWTGPFQITKKISDLNYEIVNKANKRSRARESPKKGPRPEFVEQSTETETSKKSSKPES